LSTRALCGVLTVRLGANVVNTWRRCLTLAYLLWYDGGMKKPRHEIQVLRKDGAVEQYAFDTLAQLAQIHKYIDGFFFGKDYQPQESEELEVKDAGKGF
jgi:hypothetical protein